MSVPAKPGSLRPMPLLAEDLLGPLATSLQAMRDEENRASVALALIDGAEQSVRDLYQAEQHSASMLLEGLLRALETVRLARTEGATRPADVFSGDGA